MVAVRSVSIEMSSHTGGQAAAVWRAFIKSVSNNLPLTALASNAPLRCMRSKRFPATSIFQV